MISIELSYRTDVASSIYDVRRTDETFCADETFCGVFCHPQ